MVLEKLSDSLKSTLQKITSSLFVDEKLINELVKDIQRALLQADVNVQMVFDITKKIKERALKETEPSTISKKENLIRIVYDELVNFLGGPGSKMEIKGKKPFKIMLVGLFGSGKTTLTGKLARFYKTRGNKVAIIQTDTWRPAAYEQLKQLSEKANVDFFGDKKEKNPLKIYKTYKKELDKYDIVIIDTAGRDALSDELIDELDKLHKEVQANEKLLVISADIGQAAEKQAKAFHESCSVTGVVINKLDGTAKGGGALIACSVTGAPVKFIGVGEKIADLEEFKPEGFVGRLLGMGDLEALLEKAREAMTEEEAEDMGKKFLKGEYNLIDLYEQMSAMKKMGSLSKLMEMIPGLGQLKIPKEALEVQEGMLEKWRFAMNSMTKEELEDPGIMDGPRVQRIASGSGLSVSDVRSLIKQYRQSKKLVKMMKGGGEKNMEKMMKRMSGGGMKF
ncbi:MAG: signal recognition particle protein Srp54 [Nanoarchaeota archaeon]|nr:signal recognition particle protein Srp54 [Nanoarchaeota archaeon]MBU1270009.1 signal recognition particle protein Srp54 [Nanoarchaeota archaeon]MBU1605183.1 signal recognition particle protein Srp54 [Nanoarchaeota archaeon]